MGGVRCREHHDDAGQHAGQQHGADHVDAGDDAAQAPQRQQRADGAGSQHFPGREGDDQADADEHQRGGQIDPRRSPHLGVEQLPEAHTGGQRRR